MLQNEQCIGFKNLRGVGKSLRKSRKSMWAEWGAKRRKIARLGVEWSMIIPSIQIHHAIDGISSECFCQMISKRWQSGVFNRDSIQRLQIVYESKSLSIFLPDAKPTQSIGGVRWFVYSSIDLSFNDLDNVVEDRRWNRDVALYPWCMRYSSDFDRRTAFFFESTPLPWFPDEGGLMDGYQPANEFQFFWPQPVGGIEVELIRSFLRESFSWNKFGRVSRQINQPFERIIW